MESGSDQRGYLTADVLGVQVKGLLDSGAARTIVGESGRAALEAAGLKLRPSSYIKLKVADKGVTSIKGEFHVPFNLEGRVRVITVLYAPLLSPGCIFGLDFYRRYHLVPDFVTMTCTVGAVEVEILEEPPEVKDILSPEQKEDLDKLMTEFRPLLQPGTLGCVKGVEHVIDTGDSPPVRSRYGTYNPRMLQDVHAELDERLRLGTVEPSASPWLSPLLVIPKKDAGWRWVVDFRKLNEVVKSPQQYPLPRINPLLSEMKGAAIISTIDIKDAYLQIPLSAESKEKTAFYVPSRGLFQFTRLPAGLIDAANRWQRTIEQVLSDNFTSPEPNCVAYMDDLMLWSPAGQWKEHLELIRRVFTRLSNAGITINLDKCKFARKSVKYLGHIIDEFGTRPDPGKISAVINFPRPDKVKKIQQFLGLAGWMRKYIQNFSIVAKPLYGRCKKNVAFVWTPEEEGAFIKLKESLSKGPVLRSPDFNRKFRIYTDGSAEGTGAVLVQEFEDGEHAIAYSSRALKGREKNFSATELECLGVLHAVEAFRPFVEGYEFDLVTDHSALQWLRKLKNPTGRLARWAVQLQQHRMNVIHKKGTEMKAPDALSRNPQDTEELHCALIDLPEIVQDSWYTSLVDKVHADPDSYEKFKIEKGLLFKLITVHANLPLKWVQVLPRDSRREMMREIHDDPTSAHGGWGRTFARLRCRAYWPNMLDDVKTYCNNCAVCKQVKIDRRRPPGFMGSGDVVSQPMELMSADLIGPLPRSSKGYTYLSVITDSFSKYAFIRPLRTATANAVTAHFKEDVVMKHGAPRLLLVDNGQQYRSNQFQDLCKKYNITIRYNVAYNPRSNPTERLNQTLETMICCYVADNQREWDLHLPELQAALNTSMSHSIGVTPHQVLFGEDLVLDGRERVFNGASEEPEIEECEEKDLFQKNEARLEFYLELKEKLKQVKLRNAYHYNLRRRQQTNFKPDDMVYRRNFVKSDKARNFSKKLAKKWIGPYKVKHKTGRVTYLLIDDDGKDSGPWHVEQLKKA